MAELLSLEDIDNFAGGSGKITSLMETAREAHRLQTEVAKAEVTASEVVKGYLGLSRRFQAMEAKLAKIEREKDALRAVYEAARRVLRFNGVDNERTVQAVHDLDDAIEVVKLMDSGLGEQE